MMIYFQNISLCNKTYVLLHIHLIFIVYLIIKYVHFLLGVGKSSWRFFNAI